MLVRRALWSLIVWTVLGISLAACGGDSNEEPTATDGDTETDFPDGDASDGDDVVVDGDGTCRTLGCGDGLVCDPDSLDCIPCTAHEQCELSGTNPAAFASCVNGRCVDLVCPGLLTYTAPLDAITIAARPADVDQGFDERRRLSYAERVLFPLALWGADPENLDEVREAGINVLMTEDKCCRLEPETDEHVSFLKEVRSGNIPAAIPVARPAEQLASPSIVLLDSLNTRINEPALSFWVGPAEVEDPDGIYTPQAPALVRQEITSEGFQRPVAGLVETLGSGRDLSAYDLLWPLASWSDDPQQRIADLTQKLALGNGRPVWIRLPLALGEWATCDNACLPGDYVSEENLSQWGLLALALGADGLMLDGYRHNELDFSIHSTTAANAWQAALRVARDWKDRSELWLADPADGAVLAIADAPVPAFTRTIGKTSLVFAVNPFDQDKTVTLTVGLPKPYCHAVMNSADAMRLSDLGTLELAVPAHSFVEAQFAESAQDAETR